MRASIQARKPLRTIFVPPRGVPGGVIDPRKHASTRAGFDRDEYPAAVGRGRANAKQRGLIRGINPIGWLADVEYVPSGENRSHGSSLGAKLRRLCDETRFRYVFS